MNTREQLLKCIEDLRDEIYEIEEIGWRTDKDSDDYERADAARNMAFLNLTILEKAIDNAVCI